MEKTYKVYAQCWDCGEWTFIEADMKKYGNATNDERCEHCDSHRLNPQSTISERSFDPIRAKKKKKNVLKRR